MKKKKLVFLAFATIAIALLLEAGILKYVNDSNTYRMSKVLLDRVITVLNKNDDSENGLFESLKDDYIVRAKAVSYIIDAKPQVEYDVEELQKIADLILVDEIHLFDNTKFIFKSWFCFLSVDVSGRISHFIPLPGFIFQIFIIVVTIFSWNTDSWHSVMSIIKFKIAFINNFLCVIDSFGAIWKQIKHFLF